MLNAQLIAVSNCKASRQFHSYHSCLGDVHRLIVLNDLCILGIAVQFNLVCRGCGGRYHAVLRSDIQRQRLGCLVIRGRLNLQSRLNVQLLLRSLASYLICLCNQFIRLGFVDLLCFISSSRAEGRCGNRLSCFFNLCLIFLRNAFAYLNFRSRNSRLNLNIAGVGLCNYLVAVTGYITGSGNVAACNVCARVGGEVAAGNNDFTLSRISRLANIFNRLKSLCTVMVIFSNNPLKVTASNRNSCRCSRPLVIILQLCSKYLAIENTIFDSHVAYIILISSNICITVNITIKDTAVNRCVAPVLNCLRRSFGRLIYSNSTTIYNESTRIIFNLNRNTISTTRNRQIIACNRQFAIYNNCSNCSLRIASTIRNFAVFLIANNGYISICCNAYQIVCSHRATIGNFTTIEVKSHALVQSQCAVQYNIFQQSNSLAIVGCCNSVSQRLIIGIVNLSYCIGFTQLLNSAVLVLNVTLCNICGNIRGERTASHGNLSLS